MLLYRITSFISASLLVINFVAAVDLSVNVDCSFSASSYTGPTEDYVVILKNDPDAIKSHISWLTKCSGKSEISSLSVDANQVEDLSVTGNINAYSASFSPEFVKEQLAQQSDILIIEKDFTVHTNRAIPRAVQTIPNENSDNLNTGPVTVQSVEKLAIPNLDRIDQAKRPLDEKYTYPDSAGNGVDIYVIDTGVLATHSEFEGRARTAAAFCKNCPKTDDVGHGTHVAAIAAGKTFGVAKKANIIGVKVLNSTGSGTNSEVMKGISFVIDEHKKSGKSSVVNLSLGGPFSEALNYAVKQMTDAGIHVAIAAGNDGRDACKSSPAAAPSGITVGAIEDRSDKITYFSNIGKCVDIFAPGEFVVSAGIVSNAALEQMSGTSQATPHVAGTVALMIAKDGDTDPATMQQNLIKLATKGVLPNANKGSPNRLLRVPAP